MFNPDSLYYQDGYEVEQERAMKSFEDWYKERAQEFESCVMKQMGALTYLEDFSEAIAYACINRAMGETDDFLDDYQLNYNDAVCYMLYNGKKNYLNEVRCAYGEYINSFMS